MTPLDTPAIYQTTLGFGLIVLVLKLESQIFTSGDSTLVYKCNILLLLLLLHNELMEHGGIETNELNMTPMGFPVFGLPGF